MENHNEIFSNFLTKNNFLFLTSCTGDGTSWRRKHQIVFEVAANIADSQLNVMERELRRETLQQKLSCFKGRWMKTTK